MIFWRIVDNQLNPIKETDNLGFEKSEGLRIPDEYLDNQEFMVMRTCHGIGDWGIISAMPRLLKEKYPDCKVYVPTKKLLKKLYDQDHNNVYVIFDNNPYVDEFVDEIDGEVFHDHYRIYDNDNTDISLVKQMLEFWQFTEEEMSDSQPEMYWSDEEKKLGDTIIHEAADDSEFGCLLISDRFGQNGDKVFDDDIRKKEIHKLMEFLFFNQLPYFYWTHKPIQELPFNCIDKLLDLRHIDLRIQLYIRSKAKFNIGNQCGLTQTIARYSKCYTSQRQYPIGSNIIDGEIYL
jgi:hypothetical protein